MIPAGRLDRTWLYAAVGPRLTRYEVDTERALLRACESVQLPAGVMYAWRHARLPLLYVACSDGGPGRHGARHFACVLRIQGDGRLAPFTDPVALRWRPVHISTDRDSTHALFAYCDPAGVSVMRIEAEGRLGEEVPQAPLRLAKMAHQILATPSNDRVIVPCRGNDAKGDRPEDPGSLEVFAYRNGSLSHLQTIAPGSGFGFGPRHVDFHPHRPWMYMSIERQDEIALFRLGETVTGPFFRKSALARPQDKKPRQLVGAIHLHPNGQFAYVSNRADGTVMHDGVEVFNGGENSIAVYAIDALTGEPGLVQIEDTRGMHARTFQVTPDGRLLIAANMTARRVLDGTAVREVPACLSVFRLGGDGRLAFAGKVDVEVGGEVLFWSGLVSLP